MPADDLSAVQKEAYIQVSSHLTTLHTLEVRHPSFTSPIRVVRDQRDLTAKLEPDAPVNPDTYVTFTGIWFTFIPPEINDDPNPTFTVMIDNVTHILTPYLELASASTTPLDVTYRMYSWNHITEGLNEGDYPSAEPLHMEVFSATSSGQTVSFSITMIPISNRPFRFEKYTPSRFPGLKA